MYTHFYSLGMFLILMIEAFEQIERATQESGLKIKKTPTKFNYRGILLWECEKFYILYLGSLVRQRRNQRRNKKTYIHSE